MYLFVYIHVLFVHSVHVYVFICLYTCTICSLIVVLSFPCTKKDMMNKIHIHVQSEQIVHVYKQINTYTCTE
jgi:hypothetical protein